MATPPRARSVPYVLDKWLDEQIESRQDGILEGTLQTHAEYKAQCAYVEALASVKTRLKEITGQSAKGEGEEL